MELLISGLLVAVGLAMLYFGAEWLVRGSVSIAQKFKISQLVIGLTIVAFGTSTPELSVSISSAINGVSDVALGNVVGSNIANIGLILGISAIITPIAVARQTIRKEVPIMIGVSVLLLAVSLDAQISMIEGVLLAIGVVAFTVFSYKSAKKDEKMAEAVDGVVSVQTTTYRSAILIGIGLVLLTIGSFVTVDNAVLIAQNIGISERVIGLTLVAVGTSLPELITSVVAARKGHADLSVGNIVGSNIFNILAIIGISASIAGITVSDSMWSDYYIMIIFALVLLPIMRTGFRISKLEGFALLAGYLIYTAVLLIM